MASTPTQTRQSANEDQTSERPNHAVALTNLIYNLAAALLPYINAIGLDTTRPWIVRDRAADRFNRILWKLLALTTRLHADKLGQAAFRPLRNKPQNRPENRRQPTQPRQPRTGNRPQPRPVCTRPLSARQAATRLAAILRELEIAARETNHPLPENILALCRQASALAGCQALPPPRQNLKPGFFSELMDLPPWVPLRR